MEHLTSLTPPQRDAVLGLAEAARRADAADPLNEEARLLLDRPGAQHWLASEGDTLLGYAQWQDENATGQLVVHPDHRGQGLGSALLNELTTHDAEPAVWAFGDLPAAQSFARDRGLAPARGLLMMERGLNGAVAPTPPPGVTLRAFTDADADAFLAVNAAAFAGHPEQGHFDANDLASRQAEAWWDPEGLILAEDADGLVGFHWTKRHDAEMGEVYVLGVHPRAAGRGLGTVLLDAGLAHLAAHGNRRVILYVDAGNANAVRLYERSGFSVVHTDTLYRPASDPDPDAATEAEGEATQASGPPARATRPSSDPLPEDRFLDRELSWLAFNNRVLDLARDADHVPLLERARFVAIFSGNLDEYFMVRVAGLKRRIDAGVAVPGASGLLPRDLHETILERVRELTAEQARVFAEDIRPALAREGIRFVGWDDLTADEQSRMGSFFEERVYPILTPLAVDPAHPFPYISGLSVNLAVLLRNPRTGARQFARIKVPTILSRFATLEEGRFLAMEDVIGHQLGTLFSGMEVLEWSSFRVTRNEDLEVEEDDAENILHALEKELLRRKVGRPPVRLEVEAGIAPELFDVLVSQLDVTPAEVFHLPPPLDLTGLFALASVDREDLEYPGFLPQTHPELAEVETSKPADLFKALRDRDVLLHHPYESFATSVQRFVEQAAADPAVLAIKQTLYRTSGDSPIVDALIEAAEADKQVLVVVEIMARFDEQANIRWARKLERAGCHVVYGVVGQKTHAKLCLVVRDEPDGLKRYAHIGTGNYHPKTARQYEDMGLLTSNPIITADVGRVFNHLSGMTEELHYRRLLVAPNSLRNGLIRRIETEITHARAGRPAGIRIKVNAIVDEAVIDALYRASQAGVRVDLWIRGICAVRPGVPGLSENIRVRSILGRFLEHSRLFWFADGGTPLAGLGSADLMHRNLDRRVEVLVSLPNPRHVATIGELFDLAFDPGTASWWLEDGTWTQRTTDAAGKRLLDLQAHAITQLEARRREAR
ncbi:MAG: RNA degradosome polyphosphate kinase [Actinomycetes bacterium]